ncbi:MAG: DUF262 domain-containing protein [Lentimicrobiaceae bacterium]|nr:DUF262 domain-containing protein [Lentimicrobiaceae bacterium]
MDNKVYYGEYSLKHWIDLILKGNIVLPPYQRYFVWDEDKVQKIIEAFKKRQFVPPIIIGAYKENNNQNLILDGQQRLTSILLAYLGLFPDPKIYKATIDKMSDENDDETDDIKDELDNVLSWKFDELLKKGKNKTDILKNIVVGNYKIIDLRIDDNFLEKTFLGFSYLVPNTADTMQQQQYYSTVFRSINIGGKPLTPQESRESLYFFNKDMAQFFNPDFFKIFTIKINEKLDFVRYLSLLSQYKKNNNANKIAKYFSGKGKMEEYYEEFIYSIVGEKNSTMFVNFDEIFSDNNYDLHFNLLKNSADLLDIPKQYSSIIDSDIFLFGLIYQIVFENKTIDDTKKDEIKRLLDSKIIELKRDTSHTKSPAALKYLRNRINTSIEIYKQYTI